VAARQSSSDDSEPPSLITVLPCRAGVRARMQEGAARIGIATNFGGWALYQIARNARQRTCRDRAKYGAVGEGGVSKG
jgi:hypothetical protein